MDVVKENIQELKGAIRVASEEGSGTQFAIRIPLTLAVMRALLFTAGGQKFAIALNEISEIIRLSSENVLGPHQDAVRLKDEVLPLFQMVDLLNAGKGNAQSVMATEYPIALVVEGGGRRAALVVDTLVGQREIVIKGLGSHLRYVRGISGVTIMGDGRVVPILNLEEFLWSQTPNIANTHPDAALDIKKPLKIMVVDDSISIRQVISRLMTDQGWEVQTAKDGIDALEKLGEVRPDLIVLDIEMPRMNGYEFLGALKTESGYEDIPVVILTSRTSVKHREKARSLGARGFIVKPYKDDEFVRLIHKLTSGSTGNEKSRPQKRFSK
jgi:chemosensory pili system protein ChpA (sensor histidine kinase/response regulator)